MSRASVPPELLRDIVDRYATEGYATARREDVPARLAGVEGGDLFFVRGDQMVVVQFKRSPAILSAGAQAERLSRLAEEVRKFPGTRLDVINVPDPMDALPDPGVIVSRADAAATLAKESSDVRDVRGVEAALLLAASAMEGALITLLRNRHIAFGVDRGIADLAATAWSEGMMTQDQWEDIQRAIDRRNAIAHGLTPGSALAKDDVDNLVRMAKTFADPEFLTALDLVNWFFERYKDPAEGVPFENKEGGYQYVSGGPFNAGDVLRDAFPEAGEELIEIAVDQIEGYGTDWVRIGDY